MLCETAFVLPLSLVPPMPEFFGPLPAVAPELVLCEPVVVVVFVPIVLDAPVDVLFEPPGVLELL